MKLPPPDELTEEDREAVAKIIRQADGLADSILAANVPDVHEYRALQGLVAFAGGSGLLSPSERHRDALLRLPDPAQMASWAVRDERMAATREGRVNVEFG